MPNYTTKSTVNDDLDGSMVTDDDGTVTSYTSDAWGAGTVSPQGGTGLHFKVSFSEGKSTKKYEIKAHKDGKNYKGDSSELPLESGADLSADDWTGTDTGPEPTSY